MKKFSKKEKIVSFILLINLLITLISHNYMDDIVDYLSNYYKEKIVSEMEYYEDSIDYSDVNGYIESLDKIQTVYSYEDFYPTNDDITDLLFKESSFASCPETSTDYHNIPKIIMENTKNKYEDNGFFPSNPNEATDEEREIERNVLLALGQALVNIFSHSTNNISEDICKLKNICIINEALEENVLGNWTNSSNTIKIDYQKIKDSSALYDDSYFEFVLRKVIEHEINHVRQCACPHRIENGQKNFCVTLQSQNFQKESSAESAIYNEDYEEDKATFLYTYSDERKYESILWILGAFEPNADIKNYYNAVFDSDLNAFRTFFALESFDDLKAYYKIVYYLDTLRGETDLYEFLNQKEDSASINQLLGETYKIDLFRLATKKLIKAAERDNLSLDEILVLYNTVKSYIVYEKNYGENVLKELIFIDAIFNNYLSDKFSLSLNELQNITYSQESMQFLKDFILYCFGHDVAEENEARIEMLLQKYPMLKIILKTSCPKAFVLEIMYGDLEYASDSLKYDSRLILQK